MIDSSFRSSDKQVVLVSSSDENHPPENIIDGSVLLLSTTTPTILTTLLEFKTKSCFLLPPRNTNTFWMSTGMFPQEFIIRFAETTGITAVTVDSYNGMNETKIWHHVSAFIR